MPLLYRIKSIGGKVETVSGVPEDVGAVDMFQVWDVKPTLDIVSTERKYLHTTFSPIAPVNTLAQGTLDFKTELLGSGTAGTLQFDDALWRMAGMKPTVVAGTSVTYAPKSLNQESGTFFLYEDGILKKIWGCRGTNKIHLVSNTFAYCEWHYEGIAWDDVDAVLVEGTNYPTTVPPVVQNISFTFNGYTFVVPEITIDLANKLGMSKSVTSANGIERVLITDRVPTITFDAEAVTNAEFNLKSFIQNSTQADCNIVVGTSAGNTITIDAPKASMKMNISEGDRDGIMTNPITLQCNRVNGDDEITVAYT